MKSRRPEVLRFFAPFLTIRHFLAQSSYRWGLVGALLAVLLAGLGAITSTPGGSAAPSDPADRPPAENPPRSLPVRATRLEPVEFIEQRRTYTGTLRARRASELSFDRTGTLVEVAVEEGQQVTAGDSLARLDVRNLQLRRDELTAQREAAAAKLRELQAGPREQTIAAAAARVRALQAQLDLLDVTHRRNVQLVESHAVSQDEFDRTSFGRAEARARLEAAQRELDELRAGTRIEQLDMQQAVVRQLDAALRDVVVDLEESVLVAPFDGTIAARHVDEGTVVAPATPVLRLVERQHVEAWIGLPAETIEALDDTDPGVDPLGAGTEGAEPPHEILVQGRAFAARVKAVLPELDEATRTQIVIFSLRSGGAAELVPGSVARFQAVERFMAAGFRLPTTALYRGQRGLWSVLVVETQPRRQNATLRGGEGSETSVAAMSDANSAMDVALPHGVIARRDVEVLHTDGEYALVRGTLQAGELVVVDGTHRLAPGQRVRVEQLLSLD